MTLEMLQANPAVQALGRALLHFIWQGLLLALLLSNRQDHRAAIGRSPSVRGGEPDHADDANRANRYSDMEFAY
jgi:hypothetical protein